jgi:hypothetical protein
MVAVVLETFGDTDVVLPFVVVEPVCHRRSRMRLFVAVKERAEP